MAKRMPFADGFRVKVGFLQSTAATSKPLYSVAYGSCTAFRRITPCDQQRAGRIVCRWL